MNLYKQSTQYLKDYTLEFRKDLKEHWKGDLVENEILGEVPEGWERYCESKNIIAKMKNGGWAVTFNGDHCPYTEYLNQKIALSILRERKKYANQDGLVEEKEKNLKAMMDGVTKYINSKKYRGTVEPYKIIESMDKKLQAVKEGKELKSEFDKFI